MYLSVDRCLIGKCHSVNKSVATQSIVVATLLCQYVDCHTIEVLTCVLARNQRSHKQSTITTLATIPIQICNTLFRLTHATRIRHKPEWSCILNMQMVYIYP